MDLFSPFPESNNQNQFLPKIYEEKVDSNTLEGNEPDKSKKPKKFENYKKVISLRKKNAIIMVVVIILLFLIYFTFDELLINLSVKMIDNFTIKKKITKTITIIISKISEYSFYPLFSILYLKYPLQYSFSYILSSIVIKYIHAILFLVYGVDREKEIGIRNFFESRSEKPNIQLQLIFIQFFGFWRLIKSKNVSKKEESRHKKTVNIFLFLSMAIIILIFFEEIFIGQYSINKCLMGLFIGIIVYTMIYERICFQFMKGKIFVRTIAKNYFLFSFITVIELLVSTLLYHNYNGLSDIFEVYDYNPFKDESISQYNMNKIVLKKSLFVFLLFFIIMGIRTNYKFVISKKNKNYYSLEDIVYFNKGEKLSTIFGSVFLYSLPAFILMIIMRYLQLNYKIQLVFYLVVDIVIFFIFGYVYFGIGIKKSLKKHIDEGRELEYYQNLDYPDLKTPLGGSGSGNDKVNNII